MTDHVTIDGRSYRVEYTIEHGCPETPVDPGHPGGVLVGVVWDEQGRLVYAAELVDRIGAEIERAELARCEE